MKLGLLFIGNPRDGGLYQHSLSILASLRNRGDKLVVFNLSASDLPVESSVNFKTSNSLKYFMLKDLGINVYMRFRHLKNTKVARNINGQIVVNKPSAMIRWVSRLFTWSDTLLLNLFVKLNGINILILTAPTHLSFRLIKTPFVMPIHDLQHKLNPQFIEVSAEGVWEEREYLFSNAIKNAEMVLVDSEIGREDVLNFYPTDPNKVRVLPFTPPNYLRSDYSKQEINKIKERYHLPPRFLFYPANFWSHKNHKLIIQALNYIKINHNLEIPVVFIGSKQIYFQVFDKIWELVTSFGLENQIHYLGYVPNEDIGCLYKLAEALVMPTFFGPTNYPYLEAFALGCPVIGSNIRGIREQIGNAGLLVDPNSPQELTASILKIWNDPRTREALIKRGYERIKAWNFEVFSETLNKFVNEIGESLSLKKAN